VNHTVRKKGRASFEVAGLVATETGTDVEALGFTAEGLEASRRHVVPQSTHSMRVTAGGELLPGRYFLYDNWDFNAAVNVTWNEMQKIIDRLLQARIEM
jgi:hypothetical protein